MLRSGFSEDVLVLGALTSSLHIIIESVPCRSGVMCVFSIARIVCEFPLLKAQLHL